MAFSTTSPAVAALELAAEIRALAARSSPVYVAIDGRCASGKTTLASAIAKELGCTVIHMDDFFLRPEQRSPERLSAPGGNVDYERFETDVLQKLIEHTTFSYQPFDCHTLSMGSPIFVEPGDVTLIEGSYSCHPKLRNYYDLRVFLSVAPELQLARIEGRGGKDAVIAFRDKWIPLEERYFSQCAVEACCTKFYTLA